MFSLSSLAGFKALCPFLGSASTRTLRSLSTAASQRFPSLTALTERATKCPVMGPALNVRSNEIVAGYASFAASADVDKIHKQHGVFPPPGATAEMCPHASAARAAARKAEELAAAARKAKEPADAGCPFHHKKETIVAHKTAVKPKYPGFDYDSFYKAELEKKHQDQSYRYFNNINRLAGKFPIAHTGNVKDEVQVWCANDYLGMGNNPVVLETMQYVYAHIIRGHVTNNPHSRALDRYGHGAGGTRNIAGNGAMHLGLEEELAALHRKPAALVFSSCYVANDATLSTLGSKLPGCVIFSDRMNHASMIQGMRHSTAKRVIFNHNDLEDLESKLQQYPKETPKIIAFESVYSMCGSIGPIKEICDLAEQYGAITFLDEVPVSFKSSVPRALIYLSYRFTPLAFMAPAVLVWPNILSMICTRPPGKAPIRFLGV